MVQPAPGQREAPQPFLLQNRESQARRQAESQADSLEDNETRQRVEAARTATPRSEPPPPSPDPQRSSSEPRPREGDVGSNLDLIA